MAADITALTRRSLAKLTAASIAVAALPADAVARKEYGWCYLHDDYFHTGFASHDAAAEEARGSLDVGRKFETAEIKFAEIRFPRDCGESVVDWMVHRDALGNAMAQWLADNNEEGDYEGEFSDACFRPSREAMGNVGRASVVAAIRRTGRSDIALVVEKTGAMPDGELPDEFYDKIAADRVLDRELQAAIKAWAEKHNVAADLRGLTVTDQREYVA